MKISLSEMTCYPAVSPCVLTRPAHLPEWCAPTFSCFKCFKSFNSRYVRFDKTGVLKGFIIFLTATFCPVS